MKIYISTDLEGISGITTFAQTRDRESVLYQQARHLLTAEVNAAVQGCLDGGATEIVVSDGHGGGFNFVPDELHPGATYVTGPGRPRPACGLDESFDAAMFVGYHAMNGTETGVLYHTQSSLGDNKYWYNGRESGEIAQSALICGHFDVPVVMVTGDDAACAEAREFLGEQIITVSVKEGYSRESCRMIPPARAHQLVQEGAAAALKVIDRCRPYKIDLPIRARLQLGSRELADKHGGRLSQRVDDRTFERTMESALEIYQF